MLSQRLLALTLLFVPLLLVAQPLHVSFDDAMRIGVKIWYNESNGKISGLTDWGRGENFASLGIGHFTWCPMYHDHSCEDSFPALIKYMENQGATVPQWLAGDYVPYCPWNSRSEFKRDFSSNRMRELRRFLVDTIPLQAMFMADRLEKALPRMLGNIAAKERKYVRWQFYRVADTPGGLYALMDYVDFKGEGASHSGRYSDNSWGLLQVLEEMKHAPQSLSVKESFAWAADQVLTRRVHYAPSWRHEERWLEGWRNRIATYLG